MPGLMSLFGDETMLRAMAASARRLKLFVNDRTPTKGDTVSDFVEASDAGGYVERELSPGAWTFEGLPMQATHAPVVFPFTGESDSMYGYFVVDDGGRLLMAEKFATGPYKAMQAGQTATVAVTVTQRT